MQFESKCCRARVLQDFSDINDDNESYTQPKWKCAKCGRTITEVVINKRSKRLR